MGCREREPEKARIMAADTATAALARQAGLLAMGRERTDAMLRLRGVVFDLDGTLIDSAPDLQTALNELLAGEGRRAVSLPEVVSFVGDGAVKLVERAFAATGAARAADELRPLTDRFLALYGNHLVERTRPYPGVMETLAWLQGQGVSLAVCTNKPERHTREVLKGLDLARFFPVVVAGDSFPGRRKPDPRPLQAALAALGLTIRDAAMVGDSAIDVATCRAVGLPVILHASGYSAVNHHALGADRVIGSFAELPAALADLS
jgi:phosphoglycolate phosphatase